MNRIVNTVRTWANLYRTREGALVLFAAAVVIAFVVGTVLAA